MAHLLTPPFSPGHQPGIASDAAANAGEIGEVISALLARASAAALTTDTTINVTSISLTAGAWDIRGSVGFNGTANPVNFNGGFNTTSAALPDLDTGLRFVNPSQNISVTDLLAPIPSSVLRLNATTTVYLTAAATFAAGSANAYGILVARRMR